MKNGIGIALRAISALSFLLGFLVCIFASQIGIAMIVIGIIGWNVGAKLLDISAGSRVYKREEILDEIEAAGKIKTEDYYYQKMIDQPEKENTRDQDEKLRPCPIIDYSFIPYAVGAGWTLADNKIQALTDIVLMNDLLWQACKLGQINDKLEICTEEVQWDGECASFFEYPLPTKTGKIPKYIVVLHFHSKDVRQMEFPDAYYGDIYYMQDGTIGKADLTCWAGGRQYKVDVRMRGTTLIVKKIQTIALGERYTTILYKA